jgi:hypothetical protein
MLHYGWITCDVHGKQRSYFVCNHIHSAEDIKFKEAWTEHGGASLICAIPGGEHTADDMRLMCEAHCRELGLIPAS